MAAPTQRRARLSIDVEPELRQRIKIAAAARDLSIRDYVAGILRRAIASDEGTIEGAAWAGQVTVLPLTKTEQQQGFRVLAELERLRDTIAEAHGTFRQESWELLNARRDDRTCDRMRAVDE